MKKKYYAVLFLVALLFAACKKNSVTPKPVANPLNQSTSQQTTANTGTATDTAALIQLKLAKDSINIDGIIIEFDPNSKSTYSDLEDAIYFKGYGEVSLWSYSSDNIPLAINTLPFPKTSLTIALAVHAKTDGIYKLSLETIYAVPSIYEIWLKDNYKKDSLDFRNNKIYAFNLSLADTNSYGNHRFSLVIRQNPALGIHLLNFTAAKTSSGTQLKWQTENESTYTTFTAERSTDNGTTYTALTNIKSTAASSYHYTDKTPATTNLYRIKITDLNGSITYTKSLTISY